MSQQSRFARRPDLGTRVRASFEFFPPKNDEGENRLRETIADLEPLGPCP